MYERFFSIKVKPFDLVPNPDFLFLSKSHRKAETYLYYGIKERSGFILLTGEVGCGKTTMVRKLIKGLNGDVVVSKVFNTRVTSVQLIAMINEDFNLPVENKDKISLLKDLNDFLIEQYSKRCQPILIIDEAQNLTPELLEEVRMLSNLETDRAKLLQIILVGQPELIKTLARPELRQLRQRVSINCHLFPLTREEIEEYILHRLETAGNRNAVVFEDGTIGAIYDYSRGIPRLINIICDFLMIAAFVEGIRTISIDLVREVIGELETENRYWQDGTGESSQKGTEADLTTPTSGSDIFLKMSRDDFIRIIREMSNRIEGMKDEFLRSQISVDEKGDILGRLSASEELLGRHVSKTGTEISTLRRNVEEIGKEIRTVRGLSEKLRNGYAAEETRKKSFFKRIFSR
jgi:putative secretion ATPase (PEP-CTERM system associated)